MKKIRATLFVSALVLLQSLSAQSFEPETHKEITVKAHSSSSLDNFLKTELGFPAGVNELVAKRRIRDWIEDGSNKEDNSSRFCNHFHNPLSNWSAAGLQLPFPNPFPNLGCPTTNHSSVLWGQSPSLQPSNDENFTWQNARTTFFEGLTTQNQSDRDGKLSRTFRALGQLIHLVQDAANPAHTRNDPHPFVKGFEGFVENTRILNPSLFTQWTDNSEPEPFSPSILAAPVNSSAPIPIAKIIDLTDLDQMEAVPSDGINQGIAEYSNSNFLSWDRKFGDFTFPKEESLGSFFLGIEPLTLLPRIYFPKIADGETVEHFVATSSLFALLLPFGQTNLGYVLDRRVFQDYAAKLLPRAIGYSAGLIDYFFRGRLSVSKSEIQPSSDTLANLDVANATSATDWPGNSETDVGGSNGKLIAVAFSNGVVLAVSGERALLSPLTRTPQEFEFTFPTSIPADAGLMVVFRGPLGLEDDAVIAGVVPTVVTDDFTRVGHSNSDMGPNWTEFETQTPDIVETTFNTFEDSGDGQLGLASSADCEPSPPGFPGEYGYAIWSANAFEDDQSSTATVIERIAGMGSGHPLDTTVAFIGGFGLTPMGWTG